MAWRRATSEGEVNRDLAAIVRIGLAAYEAVAFQRIE
jgi:hypothetical protein